MAFAYRQIAALLLVICVGRAGATCFLDDEPDFPDVMTVTNCHGCMLVGSNIATTQITETLQQGYNYPEVLGQMQQRLWFETDGTDTGSTSIGCADKTNGFPGAPGTGVGSNVDTDGIYTGFFHSAYDGSRLELAVISENYVKIYVNNGGQHAVASTNVKSTIHYSLCTVASNGTETCPTYITLGEFMRTDNPFILISDIPDGEYVLKVYSTITDCGTLTCPSTLSDSSTPLEVPFVVMTSAPTVSFTSSEMAYINSETQKGSMQFMSTAASRYSGRNTDTQHTEAGNSWAVYHSLFQVKIPGVTSSSTWASPITDNNDGKAAYAYNMNGKSQGEYEIEVLNVLVSNQTVPNEDCSTISCHSGCPSMCLSDFSKISAFANDAIYSAAPASRTFVYDSVAPTISADCKGSAKCDGALYNSHTVHYEFSCTDTNAPCTFYCAIDGKPTLDASTVSSLSKGYTQCSSPVSVKAAPSGSNTFTVYAVDAAGNMGALSKPFTFYTDNTQPTVQFSGVAKSCLLDEAYFVPHYDTTKNFITENSGGVLGLANLGATSDPDPNDNLGGYCIGKYRTPGTDDDGHPGSGSTPDTQISGRYGSNTCTCGTYRIETASSVYVKTENQHTYPTLLSADADSLNTNLGYYPKTVPDKGIVAVGAGETSLQYLIDGVTQVKDSDGTYTELFDVVTNNLAEGKMLYDVGVSSDTSDDISKTNSMYDTIVQIPMDITREVYNLADGEYGAVLATKQVNGNNYYHVLQATNSPTAKVNMQCMHSEIKNCAQDAGYPFQMDCGMMLT